MIYRICVSYLHTSSASIIWAQRKTSGHRGRQPWLYVSIKLQKSMYITNFIECNVLLYKFLKINPVEMHRLWDVGCGCGVS